MKTKTTTVNFRLGEDYGNLITQIAREKLIEDKDVEGAIKVLTDSCQGMEDKMAFEIILGYLSLDMDEENQQLILNPKRADNIEPTYIAYHYRNIEKKIRRHESTAKGYKYYLEEEVRKAERKNIKIPSNLLIPYFKTGESNDIEERVAEDYIELKDYYKMCSNFLKDFSMLFGWLIKSKKVSEELGVHITDELAAATFPIPDNITDLHAFLQELEAGHMILGDTKSETALNLYVQGMKNFENLNKKIEEEKKFEPSDIEKKWDAGYIAPNGDYYAVNGEIANMLHLNLADSMVTAGIIPEDFDGEINADVWLERNGWVKQHGNHILYGGYDNSKVGKKDVPITKKQIEIITYIIRLHYGGIIWAGFNPSNKLSVLSWAQSDPLQFKLKWFAW